MMRLNKPSRLHTTAWLVRLATEMYMCKCILWYLKLMQRDLKLMDWIKINHIVAPHHPHSLQLYVHDWLWYIVSYLLQILCTDRAKLVEICLQVAFCILQILLDQIFQIASLGIVMIFIIMRLLILRVSTNIMTLYS